MKNEMKIEEIEINEEHRKKLAEEYHNLKQEGLKVDSKSRFFIMAKWFFKNLRESMDRLENDIDSNDEKRQSDASFHIAALMKCCNEFGVKIQEVLSENKLKTNEN